MTGGAYLRDDRSDAAHFGNAEAVAAHNVAVGAGDLDVALNVRLCIVDPVEPSINLDGPAIDARVVNHSGDLSRAKVARINPLVSLAEKDGPASRCAAVFQIAGLRRETLRRGHVGPSLRAAITPLATGAVAELALVASPLFSGAVGNELIERHFQFATMAGSHVGTVAVGTANSKGTYP